MHLGRNDWKWGGGGEMTFRETSWGELSREEMVWRLVTRNHLDYEEIRSTNIGISNTRLHRDLLTQFSRRQKKKWKTFSMD